MGKIIDLAGQYFGVLTVIQKADSKNSKAHWLCRCQCGKTTTVRGEHLRNGATKSCGCNANIKHGLSKTRLYNIWNGMIQRCHFPHHKDYPRYGAVGIKVCDLWKNDFMAFFKWAESNGYDEGLTIDRVDGNGGYEPYNCRWETPKVQAFNRRDTVVVEYEGDKISLAELAARLKLPTTTVFRKYKEGKAVGDIVAYAKKR